MNISKTCAAVAAVILGLGAVPAAAQFPEGRITMIVPFDAGGGSDRVARAVDQVWQEEGGQSFNFVYQPGAGGAVGTAAVAGAAADGYTIGIINMPNLVMQPLAGAGTFAITDFDYIGQVNFDPIVLMVPDASPFQTLEEFVDHARGAPGTMTLAFTGALGPGHIAALQLMDEFDIEVTLVPTQGGANTVARIAGGHVSGGLIGAGLFSTQPSGRALGVTSRDRLDSIPDVPTFVEAGGQVDAAVSRVVVAPAGLPDDALTFLRDKLGTVVNSPSFVQASADQGLIALWQDGAELEADVMAMEGSIAQLLRDFGLID